MSLWTRLVHLLTLVIVTIVMAVAITRTGAEESSSSLDELIAERNLRRAIAYRAVSLQGGQVAGSFPGSSSSVSDSATPAPEGNSGAEIAPANSLMGVTMAAKNSELATVVSKVEEAKQGLTTSDEELRKNAEEFVAAVADIRKNTAELKVFAEEIDTYQAPISTYTNLLFNLDYEIQEMSRDRDSLRVEVEQVRHDEGRLMHDMAALENANYALSRDHSRAIRMAARYSALVPEIATAAASVGDPWVDGRVVQASEDSRLGLVYISIGSQDGISRGQKLAIYRNNAFVAYMRVEAVERNRAQGSLLNQFRGRVGVNAGDEIRAASIR